MSDYVYIEDVACEKGVSIQAVHQLLKRRGVVAARGGAGWCRHQFRRSEVEAAYRKKRSYRKNV